MKKVLVTGGAGFIGSNLCKRISQDYRVYCLDNFDPYYHPKIKEQNIAEADVEVIHTSLLEKEIIEDMFSTIDFTYVVHLAAQPGVRASLDNPLKTNLVNVDATLILLEALKDSQVKKTVFASSSSVYGNRLSARYGVADSLNEQMVLQPISQYGISKLMCEHYFRVYREHYGIDYVGLRYFTVYGEGIRPDLAIHRFTKAAILDDELLIYGDGSKSRDLTYVGDAVEATVLGLTRGEGIYNVGGGQRITVKSLANKITQIIGRGRLKHVEDVKGDVMHTLSNTNKARVELGWTPKTGFELGLRKTIDWIIENG